MKTIKDAIESPELIAKIQKRLQDYRKIGLMPEMTEAARDTLFVQVTSQGDVTYDFGNRWAKFDMHTVVPVHTVGEILTLLTDHFGDAMKGRLKVIQF